MLKLVIDIESRDPTGMSGTKESTRTTKMTKRKAPTLLQAVRRKKTAGVSAKTAKKTVPAKLPVRVRRSCQCGSEEVKCRLEAKLLKRLKIRKTVVRPVSEEPCRESLTEATFFTAHIVKMKPTEAGIEYKKPERLQHYRRLSTSFFKSATC